MCVCVCVCEGLGPDSLRLMFTLCSLLTDLYSHFFLELTRIPSVHVCA